MSAGDKTYDQSDTLFFTGLLKDLMADLDAGASVSKHVFQRGGTTIEFQVRVTKLNGHRLPAVTRAQISRVKRREQL